MTDEVKTYTYDKNRRYPVRAGTRCAVALVHINFRSDENLNSTSIRTLSTSLAIRRAANAWEAKWGKLPWDLVEILVSHLTIQVVVELRVESEPS